MVLGKLPVPGRRTNLHNSRARAYCARSKCGWRCSNIFFSRLCFSSLSPLWETAQNRLKYCLKGPLNQNNQPTNYIHIKWMSPFVNESVTVV